jgi:transcription initiation factor TFIIIB Brf1 subunit/transcription initiation factor TFIIB
MRSKRNKERKRLVESGNIPIGISAAARKRLHKESTKLSGLLSMTRPLHRQFMKMAVAAYAHRWQQRLAPEMLAGSLAYWVCRQHNRPVVMREVAAAVGADPVAFGRFYLRVLRTLKLEHCTVDPTSFVERVASLLPNFRRDDPAIVVRACVLCS